MQPAIALIKSMEAITSVLLNHNGILYRDLVAKAKKASGHAEPTIARAARVLREEGSIRSERVGYNVKYFLDERVRHRKVEADDFLPVRRPVINAADAPRIGGERLSPIEWVLASLSMEVA